MITPTPSNDLLSMTARWIAAVRAREREREDRLFDDPWAETLSGEVGKAWIAYRFAESVLPIVIRTRFFDDFLQEVTRRALIHQVVILAAGMDTRAFRLHWPEGTQLIELDQLAVNQEKEQIIHKYNLQPGCIRRTINVDLTEGWMSALITSGFNPEVPAVWLIEGFLFYISNAHIGQLIGEVTELAVPGSRMGFDIINGAMLTSPWTRGWVEMQAAAGAPWIGTMDDPVGYLAAHGWKATLSQAGEPNANYGRWIFPILPLDNPGLPHDWFITAEKL